jgi:hypothetical protein
MKPLPDSNSRSFQELPGYAPLVNTSGDYELTPLAAGERQGVFIIDVAIVERRWP